MWSPWAGANPIVDPNLEAVTIITSRLSQPLEGGGLRVIYLVEWACYQLVSEDAPQVPMDPSVFMLAPRSITNVEYEL